MHHSKHDNRESQGSPNSRPRHFQAAAYFVITLLITLPACRQKSQIQQKIETKSKPVIKTTERGPVTMTVNVDKEQITIAEKLNLTIEVKAEKDVDVKMPQFGNKLSEFQIRDFKEWSGVPENGTRRWTQKYVLDIYLSGEYKIPEITATFIDKRKDSAAPKDYHKKEHHISTQPITIKVTSLMQGQFDPTKFRDIKGPVDLPVERTWIWLWWTSGIAGSLIVIVLILWLIFSRRIKRARPTYISPHEWALNQFHYLAKDNLIEECRFQEFYYRLSSIVREYIERRFHIMAPEQTTEEFLAAARKHGALSAKYKCLLGDFLQAADLVKFARYQPQASEADQAFDSARDFVEQTAPIAPTDKQEVVA